MTQNTNQLRFFVFGYQTGRQNTPDQKVADISWIQTAFKKMHTLAILEKVTARAKQSGT